MFCLRCAEKLSNWLDSRLAASSKLRYARFRENDEANELFWFKSYAAHQPDQ